MRVFRLTDDMPYNEFAQAYDGPSPPPQAKTSVPENALKISASTNTGEFGFEMGKKADPKVLEALAGALTKKTEDLSATVEATNKEGEALQKTKKAAEQAQKNAAEN